MSLTDSFNANTFRTAGTHMLEVNNGAFRTWYDFSQRIALSAGVNAIPFSQIDREVLAMVRDKLVELGGSPPELPAEPTVPAAPAKKLNL